MKIYTIGHSSQTIEEFIVLVQKYEINTVVDVRSSPYSKFTPQFNRDILNSSLNSTKIKYVFMGDLLGARYNDKNLLFNDGKVCFKKVQQSLFFKNGIERLKTGLIKGYKIALMCSEKDAFDCHRFAMISEYLVRIGIEVLHVMPDKIYTQKELERRLLGKYGKNINKIELILSKPDEPIEKATLERAYELHNLEIAYVENESENDYSDLRIAR